LAAGQGGLILREDTFNAFIDALNTRLSAEGDGRFVDPAEVSEGVQTAIRAQEHFTLVRMRYHPEIYTVEAGDTSFRIARKMGIPRFLIVEANPGRDLGSLFVGDEIKLPSRDVVLSKPVVPQKRIIVNLNNQTMAAFENGQLVFQWAVSSGIETAPTSPGIFQILTHNETARGSSFALCNDEGLNCGQWVMHWFMGIYEVTPGLMNGFHGKVELPNGGLLGDGAVGRPYTFGCLMARDGDAKSLYDWAEDGTIVEVISSEFEPMSELGRQALAQNIV
jgi:LysM repeat protein